MTTKTNPFVSFIIPTEQLEFLRRVLQSVVFTPVEKREHDKTGTVKYLLSLEDISKEEVSDYTNVELHMEHDVKGLLRMIDEKRLFKSISPPEYRGLELWKLEALIAALPEQHRKQTHTLIK